MTKTYPKEVLQELTYEDYYMDDELNLVVVKNVITDTSRWSVHYSLIFHDMNEDKFYSVTYSRGATESQDEYPFEWEPEKVEVHEVHKISQIVSTFVTEPNEFVAKRSELLGAVSSLIELKDELGTPEEVAGLIGSMDKVKQYVAQEVETANANMGDDIVMNDESLNVKFKRLSETALIPIKAHPTDAGFDLFADEDVEIPYGQTKVVPTNIAIALPEGYVADVRPRSGVTSKTDLRVQYGTIDANYRGGIGIIVENNTKMYFDEESDLSYEDWTVEKGDKIAQLVILPLPKVTLEEVSELEETDRGTKGFGSTGTSL